jgi:parvulin-like peptidyl-prolyl isomerase
MNPRYLLGLSAFLLVGLLQWTGTALATEVVVANVGSIPVTQFEIDQKFQQLMPLQGGFHANVRSERVEAVRADALKTLIDRAYLVAHGFHEEVAIDNAAIETEMNKIRKKFKNDKELQEAMGGAPLASLRAAVYRQLMAAKVEQLFLNEPSKVSDQEISRYYKENYARYLRPKSFRANAIYLKVDPKLTTEEQEAKRKLAEELVAKARAGEDFYNLAYYHSDHNTRYVGGDTGFFHQGQMKDTELEKALISLKPGEIAGPIQNVYGYHILKLTEVKEETQLTFEDVKLKIAAELQKEKRDHLQLKLMEELKAKYPVTMTGKTARPL